MILRDLPTRSQGRLRSDRRVYSILNLILNVKSPPSFDPPVAVGSWETRKRYLLFFLIALSPPCTRSSDRVMQADLTTCLGFYDRLIGRKRNLRNQSTT